MSYKMPSICVIATSDKAHHMRIYYRMCLTLVKNGYEIDLIAGNDNERGFAEGIRFHPIGEYQVSLNLRPLARLQRVRRAFAMAVNTNASIVQQKSVQDEGMIVVILLLVATTLFFSRLFFRTIFAPLGVFGMIWGFSLSMLCLATLAEYPLSEQTWLLILGAWSSFLLASVLVGRARATVRKRLRNPNTDLPVYPAFSGVLKFIAIIALLGSLRFAFTVIGIAGWERWLQDSLNLWYTMTTESFDTGTWTSVFQGITMTAAALGGIWAAREPKYLPAYLPLLAAALFDLFFFGRAHTLITVGIFASGFLLSRMAYKVRWVTLLKRRTVLMIIMGTLFVGIPIGYVTQTRRGPLQEMNPQIFLDYAENLYMNWYLVEDVVRTQTVFTPGVNIFPQFSMLAYALGLRESDPREERLFNTSRELPSGRKSNTYTLVGGAYADFGMLGTWVLLFSEGVLTGSVFVVYQRRRRLWSMVVLAFVYPMLLFTVQGDQLSSPQFNVGMLLGLGLALWIERRKIPEPKEHNPRLAKARSEKRSSAQEILRPSGSMSEQCD